MELAVHPEAVVGVAVAVDDERQLLAAEVLPGVHVGALLCVPKSSAHWSLLAIHSNNYSAVPVVPDLG